MPGGGRKDSTCKIKCRADRKSKVTAKITCHPIFENAQRIGAQFEYDPRGFDFYQSDTFCGGGCDVADLDLIKTAYGPDIETNGDCSSKGPVDN